MGAGRRASLGYCSLSSITLKCRFCRGFDLGFGGPPEGPCEPAGISGLLTGRLFLFYRLCKPAGGDGDDLGEFLAELFPVPAGNALCVQEFSDLSELLDQHSGPSVVAVVLPVGVFAVLPPPLLEDHLHYPFKPEFIGRFGEVRSFVGGG